MSDTEGIDDYIEEDAAGTDIESSEDDGQCSGDTYVEPAAAVEDPILFESNMTRKTIIVAPNKRITSNRLTGYEASNMVAMRSQQIAKCGTHFADDTDEHDPVNLAAKELLTRRCPLLLHRQVGTTVGGDNIIEEWDPKTMVLPSLEAITTGEK
jgi:DNA-directed RNA polymerase subunit K/omega